MVFSKTLEVLYLVIEYSMLPTFDPEVYIFRQVNFSVAGHPDTRSTIKRKVKK